MRIRVCLSEKQHLGIAPHVKRCHTALPQKHKNSLFNFIVLFVERWRFFTIALFGFIAVYYGLGAAVSSKINNALDAPLAINASSPRYTAAALLHVLKTQVDDSPWTRHFRLYFRQPSLTTCPIFSLEPKTASDIS